MVSSYKLNYTDLGKIFNTFSATCRNIAQRVILSSELPKNQYCDWMISQHFYLLIYIKSMIKYNPFMESKTAKKIR